ncbi:PilZ domain-containing protein [Aliagarivorans taiwanensis]|uniref:PilZ domain-containing protein n=1 Tax=Aliagarivorans taiwanensis TaxID=561966 RepID=UPI0003F6002C|nr:PilZ domain-containing protein [Aliagarivorans taiwanensis]
MIRDIDKRTFQRMMIDAEVQVTKGSEQAYGLCRDLSATGMAIALSTLKLAEGDKVSVALRGEGVPPLRADATVVRVDGNEYALSFESVS